MDKHSKKTATLQIEWIEADKLVYYADELRSFDKAKVTRLKASVRRYGFVVPLIVQPYNDGTYLILDGVSRFKYISMPQYPCIVLPKADPIAPFLLNVHGEFDFSLVCNIIAYQMADEPLDSIATDIGVSADDLSEALQSCDLLE